jgi:hypothetical protein
MGHAKPHIASRLQHGLKVRISLTPDLTAVGRLVDGPEVSAAERLRMALEMYGFGERMLCARLLRERLSHRP